MSLSKTMMISLISFCTIKSVVAYSIQTQSNLVVPVFQSLPIGTDTTNTTHLMHIDDQFQKVYDSFLAEFPTEEHEKLMKLVNDSVASYLESSAFVGAPGQECDNIGGSVALPTKMAAYPGGGTQRLFGMDLAKLVDMLAQKAAGAAGAQGIVPGILAMQAVQTGAGMIQSAMSTVLEIVPRAVTGSPLTCLPMITGHNCFGAIQYPITTADFVSASTTDSQLDGVISAFPALYKRKVGTTSDTAYKACFSAYMGMHCASLFPRCAIPNAGNEPGPTGRYPMCASHCLAVLVACPGMWIDDIMGNCMDVSVLPFCSISFFANYWLLPPQYASYESSLPTSQSCPSVPASLSGLQPDLGVYDDSSIVASPYGAAKLPPA